MVDKNVLDSDSLKQSVGLYQVSFTGYVAKRKMCSVKQILLTINHSWHKCHQNVIQSCICHY